MSAREPVVVRSTPTPCTNYEDYREPLRHDFWHSCAYCSVAESEARGIGFQIDHYYPKDTYPHLKASYSNLMWSCQRCNRDKSNYPPKDGPYNEDCYVIRVDQDHPANHFELEGDELHYLTPTGEFNITQLDLNRQSLKQVRRVRTRLWRAREICAFGISELRSTRIDRLSPKERGKFLKLKKELGDDFASLKNALDDYIRNAARSILLDPDPARRGNLKKRKSYLREQKAIVPDCGPQGS